mmetsp:Transcript_32683/g.75596  ORF Transcript_32683/g.75596 Transcript_32683/m.75596 type:complete len:254 (-) Transcript_32683:52-813(-)
MKHAFADLHANSSCHWNPNPVRGDSFLTILDHDSICSESTEKPIHWDNGSNLTRLQASRAAAARTGKQLRAGHALRKPKDMLISAYCYHHRGQEYGEFWQFQVKWPDIMFQGPVEGMMALWPPMRVIIQGMVDIYVDAGNDKDVHHLRFETMGESAHSFDREARNLYSFLLQPYITDDQLEQLLQDAKVEDLHRDKDDSDGISAGSEHRNGDNCMETAAAQLLQLDPAVLEQLRHWQEQLGYSVEDWPEEVTT